MKSLHKSKVTTKFQATIPKEVRDFLKLKSGDCVAFQIVNNKVTIKKIAPLDYDYLRGLEQTLTEWNSAEDDEAYAHLQHL